MKVRLRNVTVLFLKVYNKSWFNMTNWEASSTSSIGLSFLHVRHKGILSSQIDNRHRKTYKSCEVKNLFNKVFFEVLPVLLSKIQGSLSVPDWGIHIWRSDAFQFPFEVYISWTEVPQGILCMDSQLTVPSFEPYYFSYILPMPTREGQIQFPWKGAWRES